MKHSIKYWKGLGISWNWQVQSNLMRPWKAWTNMKN